MTEYTAFSKIHTLSDKASAKAPPLPPSPMSTEMMGVFRPAMVVRFSAMAWPWPRSSAPMPQKAPEVSTKHTTGRWNFSACSIRRRALR